VNFVLDNSVAMRWFLGTDSHMSSPMPRTCLKEASALVPVTWGLEVSNVIARAEVKELVTEARSEAFLEMLEGVDIVADAATFSHALSDTLHLARRYRLIGL